MINLIPPKGHSALKHEYFLRVGSLYAFVLAGVFLAGTLLTIPTFVLVSSQLNAVRPDDAVIGEIKKTYDTAFTHIQSANTVMAQLRGKTSNIEMSKVIEEIVRVAPEGVVFSRFQAVRDGVVLQTVEVQGEAATRKTLAALKSALEASSMFETANVPISDLARETKLPFAVTITISDSIPSE